MSIPDTSRLDIDEVVDAVSQDDCLGFCCACGDMAFNVEPDARNYKCESCDAREVYGAEELLLYMA